MKKHISGKIRIWIAVSIGWVIFMRISIYQYHETIVVRNDFTDWLLSTSPVWLGWIIWWIRKGFAKDEENKNQGDNASKNGHKRRPPINI